MTNRIIKFRAWVGKMEYDIVVGRFGAFYVNPMTKGDGLDEKDSASLTPFTTIYPKETPIMQFTGLLDKSEPCKEVYEGDIINEQGIILGNIYESPQILEKGNLVTITNMGTDAWRISESVAMGRGCKYAQ